MDKQSRRDLVRDYKEKKTVAGVYAIRCAANGEVWVGGSRNIGAQQNGSWFSLRSGGHPNNALQAAWAAQGVDALTFEILERIDDKDLSPMGLADAVKSRTRHWLGELKAQKAVG